MFLFGGAALIASMSNKPIGKVFTPANLQGSVSMIVLALIGYLALVLALNVVLRMYLLRDVWVRVLASTRVHGIEAAADVSAKGELASALGEGLADGLDVVGF